MAFIIVSSPSGGGKTTICNMLLSDKLSPIFNKVEFSISATTRQKREHELHGREYFFLSKEIFEKKIQNREFLEYASVCGNLYGTPITGVSQTKHTLFDIDFQGFRNIKKNNFGNRVISIFLLPPSFEVLENRLKQRGDVKNNDISIRMQNAVDEILHCQEYDYILTNQNIQNTFNTVSAIVDFELNNHTNTMLTKATLLTQFLKKLDIQKTDTFLKNATQETIKIYE